MKAHAYHTNGRITFAKIPAIVDYPDLLNVQLESWDHFLQASVAPDKRVNKGLQQIFKMNFPITDARENYILELKDDLPEAAYELAWSKVYNLERSSR